MNALFSHKPWFFLVVGALAGCGKAADPAKPAPLVRAQVVSQSSYAPTTCLTGEVKARVQSNLSFRVSGRITERSVEVGDHVSPDKVLARIDPTEQRADLVSAQASLQSAEARVRQTAAAFARQKALIKDGFTTQRDYDQAEADSRTAEGSLDAAKAQLGTAHDTLSYTELRAGAAGVITARNAEVGQVAQAAQTMFTLAEDGPRDAVFQVYEAAFLHKVTPDSIALTLVSNPAIKATGVIREVSPSADTASGTVRVKVTISDPPPGFDLGAVVSGCAQLAPRQVIVLPSSALSSLAGKPAVWIVDPKTMEVSLQGVAIIAYETGSVVIDGGLKPGDQVVTAGAKVLHPKQTVALTTDGAQ